MSKNENREEMRTKENENNGKKARKKELRS